jgi:hypothetical protein
MAKKSSIEKNKRRQKLVKQFAGKRAAEGDHHEQGRFHGGALRGDA